jgi:hypothetical protein
VNWNGLKATGVWVHAALSAGIVGAVGAVTEAFVAPPINWRVVGSMALAGAVRGIVLHLKDKPLPPLDPRRFDTQQ